MGFAIPRIGDDLTFRASGVFGRLDRCCILGLGVKDLSVDVLRLSSGVCCLLRRSPRFCACAGDFDRSRVAVPGTGHDNGFPGLVFEVVVAASRARVYLSDCPATVARVFSDSFTSIHVGNGTVGRSSTV